MTTLLFIGIGRIKDYPIHHHPLEYADFEGEIPPGQYGAGTVTIWDRGGLVVEDFRENEKILFELSSGKMQGRYALFTTVVIASPRYFSKIPTASIRCKVPRIALIS